MKVAEATRCSGSLPLDFPDQRSRDTDAVIDEVGLVRRSFRLARLDAAALLHVDPADLSEGAISGEALERLRLLLEMVLLLSDLIGADMLPFWIRQGNPELDDASPAAVLRGPTRHIRQMRWRLAAELGERDWSAS